MRKKVMVGFLCVSVLFGGVGVYAGTIINQYTTNRGTTATVEREDIHKNRIGLEVNGKTVKTDSWYANGVTYIPLREVSNLLGATIDYNQATQSAKIHSAGQPAPAPAPSATTQTINKVTVTINKVVQDADSLKIYVTYVNNSSKEIRPAEGLSRIVANGTQYDYDLNFNFERYYDKDVPKASDSLEPGVTAQSVIFFKPVSSNTINIVLGAEYEDYRFNNIPVQK
ncbi:stalk domain-containing protein [Bacillus benzoevorans]|uniref:Copper amine oxidase-like N-terminal domain-containing protein n=1 Tax=Bacillus benzoevorans TaxID=1456 RepID=A0A7X0HVK8_9BACI|nr:stalk domain-containing protein [Bacillus benzoevorans]MBB6446747.1 hypothetical protein [Bacillus benzoevorans]